MIHLLRDYRDKKPITECGKEVDEKSFTFKACQVTCPKCQQTKAFAKAARDPFYGIPKLDDWEKDMFK